MKILMIGNHESVPGGITSVIQQILSYDWNKNGIKMKFLSTYKGGNAIFKILYFLKAVINLLMNLLIYKPDLVYIHMSHHGSFDRANCIYRICNMKGIPVIIHLHGSEFAQYYDEVSNKKKDQISSFFDGVSAVITLGKKWEEFIKSISSNENIIILNNSIHIPAIVSSQEEKTLKILFLGVLYKRKGVEDFLNAVNLFVHENKRNSESIKFYVGGDGPEKEKLQNFVKDNNLEANVEFLGWISSKEKSKYIEQANVFALPSYNEGLPIAILEAISYGLPVIATDVGSVKEVVIHDKNGYLCKPGDINGYLSAIEDLYSNHDKRKKLAVNSRVLAENNFDEVKYFDKLEEIFNMIKRRR